MLTGVLGGFASTSYSENIGLVGLTKVGSRYVVVIGAVSVLDQRVSDLPGDVTIRWQPIRGAVTYTVEINVVGRGTDGAWSLWNYVVNLEAPEYTFEIGSGPSRWRVWAVDATDRGGPISEWSELVSPAATR